LTHPVYNNYIVVVVVVVVGLLYVWGQLRMVAKSGKSYIILGLVRVHW